MRSTGSKSTIKRPEMPPECQPCRNRHGTWCYNPMEYKIGICMFKTSLQKYHAQLIKYMEDNSDTYTME